MKRTRTRNTLIAALVMGVALAPLYASAQVSTGGGFGELGGGSGGGNIAGGNFSGGTGGSGGGGGWYSVHYEDIDPLPGMPQCRDGKKLILVTCLIRRGGPGVTNGSLNESAGPGLAGELDSLDTACVAKAQPHLEGLVLTETTHGPRVTADSPCDS